MSRPTYHSERLLLLLMGCVSMLRSCAAHGRLIEPPSRASAWRYGFQTPPDYNDHELYCGGFTRQWKRNGGQCGECGDAYDMREPRPHEHGGAWGVGVIVRRYSPGSDITIRVELTASHMGYFEFRLCPEARAKQECLDRHLLPIHHGSPAVPSPTDLSTRFYPRNGSRIYEINAQLPELECQHCVLQWRYIAGNNWGMCPNGNGAVGCGPQEEFRACSDIAVSAKLPVSMRPIRPTSMPPKTVHDAEAASEGFDYTTFLVAILLVLLFFAICFALYYLHQKRSGKFHQWFNAVNSRFCRKLTTNAVAKLPAARPANTTMAGLETPIIGPTGKPCQDALPVAPPRTKRLARVRELSPDESSVA